MKWLFTSLALLLAGCALLPEMRVLQKKVDPKMAEKPPEQVEAERRAASWIKQATTPTVADPARMVEKVHEVATGLSSSLGEPKEPVKIEDQAKVIADLRTGLLAEQKKAEQWRAFAIKYAGKPLEDTGINLAGPAGLLAFVGVILACVAFPPLGYVLLRALPLLWGFFRRTTEAIGEFAKSNPEAGQKLATTLSRKMDGAHKSLVRARAKANRIPETQTA